MRYPRHVRFNPRDPEAVGQCDRGKEICNRSDLKPEMVWAGNELVWNGFLVCDRHRDPPQPQSRAKILAPDPVPIKNPRPDNS